VYSDRSTIRNLLLNTLYYYNTPEKIKSFEDKITLKKDKGKKKEDGEQDSDFLGTDELIV
jgi:hypothetical protein